MIIIIIIYFLQSTVGKIRRRPPAITYKIPAQKVLKIALETSFVRCQPTNAVAQSLARRLCRLLCRLPRRQLSQVCIMLANSFNTLLVLKFASYPFSLSFKFVRFNFEHLVKTYSRSFKLAQVIFRVRSFWFV